MSAHRFGGLIRNATRLSLQSSATSPRSPPPTKFFAEDVEGGSEVYGHALKFQRPTTITLTQQLVNSVSFIGSVESPLRIIERVKLGRFGVSTLLSVKASPDSNHKFRSFRVLYKVSRGCKAQNILHGAAGLEVHENRLHLWQVFFTNPYEWWDNRKRKDLRKVNLSAPDFKHKDTGEVLWLNPNDPPWIKRQLELLDTKMAEKGQGDHVGSHSRVSMWVYDEY
ncbi:hypothetical protein F2P56_034099 [Juglans regia]|uniref:Protein OSB1, mitochondrial isoform X2 n=2 Tax=Juglans regia TaxID=51240 RepID=A0A2I4EST9_JUGRE|nr:protein OSB1, mitochondrial isoform X2 [Juglans regia]KAF5445015.1 hypothetical protein F2P56_034099 [Juglans regia]